VQQLNITPRVMALGNAFCVIQTCKAIGINLIQFPVDGQAGRPVHQSRVVAEVKQAIQGLRHGGSEEVRGLQQVVQSPAAFE
jgi:hypothetical protein